MPSYQQKLPRIVYTRISILFTNCNQVKVALISIAFD